MSWTESSVAGHFAYRSNSYLILSEQSLGKGRIASMAMVAESVRAVLQLFPLELLPGDPPLDGQGARSPDVVRIYATQKDYITAGGPGGSVGFFNARTGEVMVSRESLIEPKGQRSNLEPRQRYRLLVHELVHQAMGARAAVLPLWFTEGIAEYIAAMQFAPGRYRFDIGSRQIISHFRAVWLHDRRNIIAIPTVDAVTRLNSRTWAADNRMNNENAYAKYAASLLLTHYQLELASRGLGGLREFLADAMGAHRTADDRHWRWRHLRAMPDQALLWKDRPPLIVQKQLKAYWKGRGLNLEFTPLRPLDEVSPRRSRRQ